MTATSAKPSTLMRRDRNRGTVVPSFLAFPGSRGGAGDSLTSHRSRAARAVGDADGGGIARATGHHTGDDRAHVGEHEDETGRELVDQAEVLGSGTGYLSN